MATLEERVAALETANSRWRAFACCAIVMFAAMLCVAGTTANDRVIEAHEFRVVDDSGSVLALLGRAPEGGAHVAFNDDKGKPSSRFGTFVSNDEEGRRLWSALQIAGSDGEPRIQIGSEGPVDTIWIHDADGRRRVSLDVRPQGTRLKLADSDGNEVFSAP